MKKSLLNNLSKKVILGILSMAITTTQGYSDTDQQTDKVPPELSRFEQDRQAILAMVGEYEVDFDFEETVVLDPEYQKHAPHHSKAREFVTLVKDEGELIVLQHILVSKGRMVIKHWRQDWHYQPKSIMTFKGERTWGKEPVSQEDISGLWAQVVYQVDDSPRYTALGRWSHQGNISSWESSVSQRPLPRREHSTRKDYDQMFSAHRLTLLENSWIHEQDTTKAVSNEKGSHFFVREKGINSYSRLQNANLQAGYDYWEATQPFWQDVREAWDLVFENSDQVKLRAQVDESPLWMHMFKMAREVNRSEEAYDSATYRPRIAKTFRDFLEVGSSDFSNWQQP